MSLYKTNDEFREKVDNALAKVKQAFSDMWVKIQPIIEQIKQAFMKLLNALQPVFEFILTYIGSIVNGIISAAAPIMSAVQNVFMSCHLAPNQEPIALNTLVTLV